MIDAGCNVGMTKKILQGMSTQGPYYEGIVNMPQPDFRIKLYIF